MHRAAPRLRMQIYAPYKKRQWNGPPPNYWLDSNAMNEFASAEDLAKAAERSLLNSRVEYRRLRVRGTYWMAVALDVLGAVTIGFADETIPFALRTAAGDSSMENWLTVVHHFVKPEVLPNWKTASLDALLRGRSYNDTLAVDDACERGIPIITRDAGVAKKARNRGGTPITPEDFASGVITLDDARKRFFERYDARSPSWALSVAGARIDWKRTRVQCEGLRWARPLLQFIWGDESALEQSAVEQRRYFGKLDRPRLSSG